MKQVFLIIIFLSISYKSNAIDCPPSSTCTIAFESNTFGLFLDNYSANGEYDDIYVDGSIRYRKNCEGVLEIIVDDFYVLYPDFYNFNKLDNFNYLHFNYSSLTEWVALDFLMIINAYGTDDIVPYCSTNTTKTRVHVYTASCGIWTKCSYKLPNPIEKVCDTGWQGGDPHYGVPNPGPPPTTDMWVDHWKWQSCGEVCCRKVFELCREENVTYPGYYVKIKAMTKEKYPDSECSKQGDFTGPRPFPTSTPFVELQCEDGC